MDYKVALGHNVAEIALVPLVQQARGGIATPVQRQFAASYDIYDQGLYVDLIFDFIESEYHYIIDLLTQFGLEENDTSEVTIFCYDRRLQWERYNGTAILPEPQKDVRLQNFFIRDVTIRIIDLEVAT